MVALHSAEKVARAVALAGALAWGLTGSPAGAVDFTVNSTLDAVDANPGNGVCATSAGRCALRAAVMEANALAGLDRVLLAREIYRLTIPGPGAAEGDLDVSSDLEIVGVAGTIVGGTVGFDGIVDVAAGTVTMSNLLLVDAPAVPGGCIRSSGALTQSKVRCGLSPIVFVGDFEIGTTAAWSATVP